MIYAGAALIGAVFGTIGPVWWSLAWRAGHYVGDNSRILDRLIWIFPCSILFLGFPRAEHTYPHGMLLVEMGVGMVNALMFALIAVAIVFCWHLVAHS